MSANAVMANILHLAEYMDEDLNDPAMTAHDGPSPPILAFVAAGRGSHNGRGPSHRDGRGGRGLPNKCSACGSLTQNLSSCTSSDDALLKWTLAKRKVIIKKYGTPCGNVHAHAALPSDDPTDDIEVMPTLKDCTDEYDDTEVNVPFRSIGFSSSLGRGRDLSHFWVIDSARSIN
jgi:hypothetical protein